MSSFAPLARSLLEEGVRFVLIGVAGVNLHARDARTVFSTLDRDVFLPLDAGNLLAAWRTCEAHGLSLSGAGGPLARPRDLLLAERVVQARAATRADDGRGLVVDLTLTMAGFEFEEVWAERTAFLLEGVAIPVARLAHIVSSKAAAGREKDRLFLAAHDEALRELLSSAEDDGSASP